MNLTDYHNTTSTQQGEDTIGFAVIVMCLIFIGIAAVLHAFTYQDKY